jgi:hypothetical protein
LLEFVDCLNVLNLKYHGSLNRQDGAAYPSVQPSSEQYIRIVATIGTLVGNFFYFLFESFFGFARLWHWRCRMVSRHCLNAAPTLRHGLLIDHLSILRGLFVVLMTVVWKYSCRLLRLRNEPLLDHPKYEPVLKELNQIDQGPLED